MMGAVPYPQLTNTDSYQMSPNVTSSTGSPPVLSSFNTVGYSNANAYFNTPVMSSASCTPIQCPSYPTSIMSSTSCTPTQFPSYPDLPPVLNLNNNVQGGNFPQQISCNINTVPVPSECPNAAHTSASVYPSNNLLMKQPNITGDCCSINELSEKTERNGVNVKDGENVWIGSCNYVEYQHEGSSNLFITWSGTKAELVEKFQNFKLEVLDVLSTSDSNVCNVIFKSHPIARKAFTMQSLIQLRIVPPKNSHRIWLRNPSPKFLVKFETKCRLVVRKGKAECHDIVGELLKGCLISADQLKGNRIRVVCCDGSFMFPGGKIVEMKGVPSKLDDKASLGWISYRCKYTKESLVIRRSWNMVSDYIYQE